MLPIDCAENTTPALFASACRPSTRVRAVLSTFSQNPDFSTSLRVAKPAATATGLPDSVPAWYTGPSGAIFSMIWRRPPTAPTGSPPPMTLPSVVRSGRTP